MGAVTDMHASRIFGFMWGEVAYNQYLVSFGDRTLIINMVSYGGYDALVSVFMYLNNNRMYTRMSQQP